MSSLKSREERKDRERSPAARADDAPRSPVGSPARSLLSRAQYAHSPATATQPSPTVMAAQAAAIRASPLRGSSVSASVGAGPSIRSIEAANHNEPYTLGARDVTLPNKYLKDEGCAKVMHELLGRGPDLGVVSLDLRGNDIRRYGAEAIGELMRENTTVETLNLEWNFLGDSGGSGLEVLCDALKTNRTLSSLDLRNNRLNSECGLSLAQLLIVNRTIQSLDLRWNNLGAPGGAAIADALVRNHHVRHIMLSGNRIPSATIKAIEEALAKNREVGLLCGKVAPKEDAERLMLSEATVADLHREISRLQGTLARTEQELLDEKKRCDELTDSLASLRDKSATAKTVANKRMDELQMDLERTQAALFECQRRADAGGMELKTAQAQIVTLTSELSMAQEDRSRLLLSRESSSATLNAQLEASRSDWNRLNESSHAKEAAWETERADFDAKMTHLRRIAESEKELAVTAERERNRALQAEIARLREDHSAQMSELHARLKAVQDSSGDSSSSVLALRESLVRQAITHEEALAKLESQYRSEGSSSHAKTLRAFEDRLKNIEAARDELAESGEAQKAQYGQLLAQLSKERAEHLEAMEKERVARSELGKQTAAAHAESYAMKARLLDQEHRLALAGSQHESSAAALQDQARRHQEQVEQVYAQARAEARTTERALRSEQDERARLAQKVRTLEARLAQAEAEQTLRSQNLATALSALKSSVSVVDQNVQRDLAKSAAEKSSSGGGGSGSHHRSDRERDAYESSSLTPRHEHTSSDRDRDRDRDRSVPSSPSHGHRSSSSRPHSSSHREGSSGRHHHHSHYSSSNSRRDSGSAPSGAAPSSSSRRADADAQQQQPAPTMRTQSTPATTSAPSSKLNSPSRTSTRHVAAAPSQQRRADASDPEGSLSFEDESQAHAPPSQSASRVVSASQSYAQQPNDEDVEVDYED